MNFNEHSDLNGCHAILAPSNPSWLNYSKDDLINSLKKHKASQIGTAVHELASMLIDERMKLHKQDKKMITLYLRSKGVPYYAINTGSIMETLMPYVNDAIGFRMHSEKVLYHSDVCFGTADAIVFDSRSKVLRIHDLKTGVTQGRMEQLKIYAALYLLEYGLIDPEITIELRIYQRGEIFGHHPDLAEILAISKWIEEASSVLLTFDEEQGG